MKGLLYKDTLTLIIGYTIQLGLATAFLLSAPLPEIGVISAAYGIILGSMLPSMLQEEDEKSKWCTYCDVLPISRSFLVKEKFTLTAIVIAVSAVLIIILQSIVQLFSIGPGFWTIIASCLAMTATGIISASIALASAFIFGPQKSQFARLIVFFVIALIYAFITSFIPELSSWLSGLSSAVITAAGIAGTLGIAYLCFRASCTGFEKRSLL